MSLLHIVVTLEQYQRAVQDVEEIQFTCPACIREVLAEEAEATKLQTTRNVSYPKL